MASVEESKINPYDVYITKIYRTIPKNCALIIRNKFNGERIKVKNGGFALIAPWYESKLVSLAVWNIDYEKLEFDDKEGQQLTVDLALSVRINDPIKYEYAHQNISQELKVKLYSMVRVLIRKATWEELSKRHFELPKQDNIKKDAGFVFAGGTYYYRDSIYKDDEGNWNGDSVTDFDLELFNIRRELNEFANEYGLEIVSLGNKAVQQSEEMQKAYDEKVRKMREMQAKIEEAKLEKEKVDIEVEITKKRQNAYNDQFISLLTILKDRGYSETEAIRLAQTLMVAQSGNSNIANATASTIAGVSAGVAATEFAKEKKL